MGHNKFNYVHAKTTTFMGGLFDIVILYLWAIDHLSFTSRAMVLFL